MRSLYFVSIFFICGDGNSLAVVVHGYLRGARFIDWMLGLAISLSGTATGGFLKAISVSMFPVQVRRHHASLVTTHPSFVRFGTSQILNLAAVLFVFSLTFTFVAYYWPHGPQPAAYGHIQTLANLIDEWAPVMWWGDKPVPSWSQLRRAGK